jgi:taurine--2-oxoglutarate transaminase
VKSISAKPSLQEFGHEHVVYGWQPQGTVSPITFERADRIYLWDTDQRRYIDFCSAQMNVNVGYGHPRVLAAMREQMERMTYVAPMFATEPRTRLAAMVAERTPGDLDWVFFTNSGSESIENAIKISRAVTGRSKIYSAWQSYHGATAGASAISGDPRRLFVEPGIPGTAKFHGAVCYRCPFGQTSPPDCRFACVESLRSQVVMDGPETVAAMVIEPIAGTSGVYVWPPEFVRGIRTLCDDFGILMIADETMSGWGRTGKWFACEHYGVVPDILTTAKGITSGYVPLGACVVTPAIRDYFVDKTFVGGLTNEGHALACAAGIANIEAYESEGLIEKSRELGNYLHERLSELKCKHPSIGDVRGKGLFACLELTADRCTKTPLADYRNARRDVAARLTRRLLDMGLFLVAKWDFVFIAPPLVIEKDELDEGLRILDHALDDTDELAAGATPA